MTTNAHAATPEIVIVGGGIRFLQAAVASVDAERRRVILRSGETLPYDSLVMAHGSRTVPAFDGVVELGGTVQAQEIRTLRDEIGAGKVRSVAFVAGPAWTSSERCPAATSRRTCARSRSRLESETERLVRRSGERPALARRPGLGVFDRHAEHRCPRRHSSVQAAFMRSSRTPGQQAISPGFSGWSVVRARRAPSN